MATNGSAVQRKYYKLSYFDYMNPHYDLDLEVSTPIILHHASAHDDSSYLVRSKKGSVVDDIKACSYTAHCMVVVVVAFASH